jgi:hypothetical protein
MLNVTYMPFMLSVVMLSVVMLNVIMLSVVAPLILNMFCEYRFSKKLVTKS